MMRETTDEVTRTLEATLRRARTRHAQELATLQDALAKLTRETLPTLEQRLAVALNEKETWRTKAESLAAAVRTVAVPVPVQPLDISDAFVRRMHFVMLVRGEWERHRRARAGDDVSVMEIPLATIHSWFDNPTTQAKPLCDRPLHVSGLVRSWVFAEDVVGGSGGEDDADADAVASMVRRITLELRRIT